MFITQRGLGTALRHLIDLIDGDVQARYEASGLSYRPRYTPVVKALALLGEGSIKSIASHAGLTHSAASQTVAQLVKEGLVRQVRGRDGRERIVCFTPTLTAMMPRLLELWAATDRAALELDAELSFPLSVLLCETTEALAARPFRIRIQNAEALT
ncbi:MAG: MarR family transcriptional regulator [Pseudomonadota bacterium]|nr:MarR family transcriptional regulator [Pseudomonadota bacterium]